MGERVALRPSGLHMLMSFTRYGFKRGFSIVPQLALFFLLGMGGVYSGFQGFSRPFAALHAVSVKGIWGHSVFCKLNNVPNHAPKTMAVNEVL